MFTYIHTKSIAQNTNFAKMANLHSKPKLEILDALISCIQCNAPKIFGYQTFNLKKIPAFLSL